MFCNNCGNVVGGKSQFCTWCGSRLNIEMKPYIPQPEAVDQNHSVQASGTETACLNNEQTADIPEQAAQQGYSQPEPEESNVPPQGNEGSFEQEHSASIPSEQWSFNVPLSENPIEQPQDMRKYYTGGQLALCLVITGFMAAAAGVFAGLYFSVVL